MASFIAELKASLPQADWPVVVTALRAQPLIWEALQEESFGRQALEAAGNDPDAWSPAFLGLLSLGQPQHYASLRAASLPAAEEKLRYQAAAAYEALLIDSNAAPAERSSLAQAALLAIALRERYRQQNSWADLIADLAVASAEFWSLPLACLAGMLADPADMLATLFGAIQQPGLQKAGLAAMLSNPLALEEQVALLDRVATQLELPAILNLLRNLAAHRSPLAQSLARQALDALPESPAPKGDQLDQLHKMVLQSEIHQLSGQPEQALPLLNAAWETAQSFQATLAAKLAEANGSEESAITLEPEWLEENAALREGGRRKKPAALISAARVAIKAEDFSEAEAMAAAALQALQVDPLLDPDCLPRLSELFLDLGLPADAKQAAILACETAPNDGHSAQLLSRAEAALGNDAATLEAAHLAVALQPEDIQLRRELAQRLEEAGAHMEALPELEAIVALDKEASEQDWLALAACALTCDSPGRCIEACGRLIEKDSEHGLAHALMGRALMLSGDTTSAVGYLQRATRLAPSESEPWLALAAYQRERGDFDQALETLSTAVESAFASPLVHAALGEVFEALEKKADALAAYLQARGLASASSLIESLSLRIGLLQIELDQVGDARATLEFAHQAYPANPQIARHYAHLLLEADEPAPALSALAIARQALPDDPDIQLDTARAQIALGKDFEGSRAILEHILKQQAEHWDARALLAETHQALGEPEKALKGFVALSKAVPDEKRGWIRRLGLGKAAAELALDKVDEAIATLEALSKDIDSDLDVQRALCSAYQRAGRADEAFQIARQVYLSSAKDQASLLWYAEQAAALDKAPAAIEELSKAAKGEPEITLKLAELQWSVEDHSSALKTFAQLLHSETAGSLALTQAARFLQSQEATPSSLPYWQRAIELAETPSLDLHLAYSQAQQLSGELEGALASLEAAIELAPNSPELFAQRAGLQQQMGRPKAALLSLDLALDMLPEDAGLLAYKSRLLYAAEDWATALDTAERALVNVGTDEDFLPFAASLAADCLQPQRARALLSDAPRRSVELACLNAELALDLDEELEAAQALAPALETDEDDVRVQAMQARLAARRGDLVAAEAHYHAALKDLSSQAEDAAESLIAIGLAGAELRDWETALKVLRQAVEAAPQAARAHFALGKVLVQRAEWQQICQAAEALRHAPGTVAIDPEAAEATLVAFENASHSAPFADARALISHWAMRAQLRFSAEQAEHAVPAGYPARAEEAAALVYAAGRRGNEAEAGDLVGDFASAAEVQIEMAVAVGFSDVQVAMQLSADALQAKPGQALYQAIVARFAKAAGQDKDALEHINLALSLWPNEPRWHALAAELHQAAGRLPEAAHHLELAASQESHNPAHHTALGQVQLQAGQFAPAIKSLSQARELDSQDAIALLALAKAHKGAEDLDQALDCAAKAARLSAGNDIAALLLQVELSLQEGQAEKAKKFAEQALQRNPKDGPALRLYAEALAVLGAAEDAIGVLERAMKDAADPVPLQVRRAQLLPASRGEHSGLETLIRLSQRHPERAEVFQALSEVLALAGEFEDALQAAQRAVKHSEQLEKAAQAGLRLHYARMLKHFGQLDQALYQLDEALKLASHLVEVQLERGQVFLSRRQFDQALDAYAEASRVAPRNAEPHLQAGLALKEAKDYAAAEAELRLAAELAPKDARIQRQLAGLIALNLVHQTEKIGV